MAGLHLEILNTATGETRTIPEDHVWSQPRVAGDDDQAHGVEYWWTEGNGSCDCNRELEFMRAGGLDPETDETECHAENAYLIRLAIDGAVVVDEITPRLAAAAGGA